MVWAGGSAHRRRRQWRLRWLWQLVGVYGRRCRLTKAGGGGGVHRRRGAVSGGAPSSSC